MRLRYKIIIAGVALLTAFAFGRYSAPVKIVEKEKIVEVEKKRKKEQIEREKHTQTVTQEIKYPDGKTEKITTVTQTVTYEKNTTETEHNNTTTEKEKEIIKSASRINLGVMAGYDLFGNKPAYGGYINKDLIGPINAGIWGLTTGVGGVSIGLSF